MFCIFVHRTPKLCILLVNNSMHQDIARYHLGEKSTMVSWTTMVDHSQQWLIMVYWPWSTIATTVTTVNQAQPSSLLTMVDHSQSRFSELLYHVWPWLWKFCSFLTIIIIFYFQIQTSSLFMLVVNKPDNDHMGHVTDVYFQVERRNLY